MPKHEPWTPERASEIIVRYRHLEGATLPILHALQETFGYGDWVKLSSRAGETTLRAKITERVAPGVVYTTFHHPNTQVNVVTTEFSDWATNCPEYKVTAVQVSPSNGPSEWQEEYEELSKAARRIAAPLVAAE